MSVVCQINCVGGITCGPRACSKSFFWRIRIAARVEATQKVVCQNAWAELLGPNTRMLKVSLGDIPVLYESTLERYGVTREEREKHKKVKMKGGIGWIRGLRVQEKDMSSLAL